MDKLTQTLIYAVKNPNGKGLFASAAAAMAGYSASKLDAYTVPKMYSIVTYAFADYLQSTQHANSCMQDYYRAKSRLLFGRPPYTYLDQKPFFYPRDIMEAEIEAMLEALQLVQVKNDSGNYINGLTEE